MYAQIAVHNSHDPGLPIRVTADDRTDRVSLSLGLPGQVYLSLTVDEARRVADGITTALAVIDARAATAVAL